MARTVSKTNSANTNLTCEHRCCSLASTAALTPPCSGPADDSLCVPTYSLLACCWTFHSLIQPLLSTWYMSLALRWQNGHDRSLPWRDTRPRGEAVVPRSQYDKWLRSQRSIQDVSTAPNSAWVKVMGKKKGKAVTKKGTLALIHQAHCGSVYERGAGRWWTREESQGGPHQEKGSGMTVIWILFCQNVEWKTEPHWPRTGGKEMW